MLLRLITRAAPALLLAASFARPLTARAQVAVVSSTVEERTAKAGERYVGVIRVLNASAQPQAVRIYQTDYLSFADGTSHFDAPGSTARSNARWITPTTSRVVVPPGREVGVSYAVSVPAGDSLDGTYWSTVMVEGIPTVEASATPAKGQVAVGAVVRYAVQVATTVNGGSRKIAYEALRVEAQPDGARTLEYVVRNDGARAYRPVLWMELYDESGALVVRRQQDRGLFYPGTTAKQRFDLGAPPPGAYKVVLFADTGEDAVYAMPYRLKL